MQQSMLYKQEQIKEIETQIQEKENCIQELKVKEENLTQQMNESHEQTQQYKNGLET